MLTDIINLQAYTLNTSRKHSANFTHQDAWRVHGMKHVRTEKYSNKTLIEKVLGAIHLRNRAKGKTIILELI